MKLLNDLGYYPPNTTVFIDNKSTIAVIKNPAFHHRTKHVDIKMKSMRELYNKNIMAFEYVPTDDQLADGFTKALTGAKQELFVKSVLSY